MIPNPKNKIWYWMWDNVAKMPNLLVRRWQLYRLRHLLVQHFLFNPFYRRILLEKNFNQENLKNLKWEDLQKIPVINKDMLRAQPLENCIAKNVPRTRFVERATSGSTGNPFRFWVDLRYKRCYDRLVSKVWREQGYKEDLRLALMQVILPPKNTLSYRLHLPGLNLFDNNLALETIKKVLNFGAKGIVSFPSFLIEFCNLLENYFPRIKKPVFEIAFTTGEALREPERTFIEEHLGCKIFDRYGVTEFFIVGQECRYHNGFHLNSESYIFEVTDDSGKPLPRGAEGNVVITNLDNEIMPFIRYDTGDRGHIMPNSCPCGNPSLLFKIKGRRNFPKIWTVRGKKINPFLFYEIFLDQSGLIQYYQARRKSESHIQVLIVPGTDFRPDILEKLRRRVMKALQVDGVKIDFVLVSEIPPGPHGKRQDFVDEIELGMIDE